MEDKDQLITMTKNQSINLSTRRENIKQAIKIHEDHADVARTLAITIGAISFMLTCICVYLVLKAFNYL